MNVNLIIYIQIQSSNMYFIHNALLCSAIAFCSMLNLVAAAGFFLEHL